MPNVFGVIKLLLEIALDIVDAIKKKKNVDTIMLKDLPGWKKWKRRVMNPNFSKALKRLHGKKGKK